MESFLSGYSRGYAGSVGGSVGAGYASGVSGAGASGGASSNSSNADISQLKPGDTFQGEIASVNGEDVQIQLANGQYLSAKLEHDVQVALGQVLNLQVQSNKDNKVVLKPVVDGNAQMLRVGEAALRAANMSVNEKNLALVAKLIENGMPINKNTLMTYNRLAIQNPKVNLSNIIELNKLKLPITEDNARQLENYRSMEHKIIEGVKDAANELVKTYESIVNNGAQTQGSQPHLPAIQSGVKFMENVLSLIAGEGADEGAAVNNTNITDNANNIKSENNTNVANNTDNTNNEGVRVDINTKNDVNVANTVKNANTVNNATVENVENKPFSENHLNNNVSMPAKNDAGTSVNLHGENVAKAENADRALTVSDNDIEGHNVRNLRENVQNDVQKGNIQDSAQIDGRKALTEKTVVVADNIKLTDTVSRFDPDINSGQELKQQVPQQASKQPQTADVKIVPEAAGRESEGLNEGVKTDLKVIENQLKGEAPKNVPERIINYISGGKLDIKMLQQLLSDTGIGKSLTPEQKSKIFDSEPFKHLLKTGLGKRWSLAPADVAKEGKVEEFYEKLLKEANRLTKLINEAVRSTANAHTSGAPHAKAMGNIAENVEFINQMNHMFNYVQLPLKFSDSQAHGDLYVYTNKKNIAHRDGLLTAFLHLDMENLGPLDVSIALQTEKKQITTKFYIGEDSIKLVGEHMGELVTRLEKKGYKCKSMTLEKDEDKTVLEHIEEQVAAGNAVIGYRTFDTRA